MGCSYSISTIRFSAVAIVRYGPTDSKSSGLFFVRVSENGVPRMEGERGFICDLST